MPTMAPVLRPELDDSVDGAPTETLGELGSEHA